MVRIIHLTYEPDMQQRVPLYTDEGEPYRVINVINTEYHGGVKVWICRCKPESTLV